MPIYGYRCSDCGFQKDHLQKISDAPIGACPSCGSHGYVKQLSAAGFQLKGSGWYATDFKSNGSKPAGSAKSEASETNDNSKNNNAEGNSASNTSSSETSPTPTSGCSPGCACH